MTEICGVMRMRRSRVSAAIEIPIRPLSLTDSATSVSHMMVLLAPGTRRPELQLVVGAPLPSKVPLEVIDAGPLS